MPDMPSPAPLFAATLIADVVALGHPEAALPVGASSLLLLLAYRGDSASGFGRQLAYAACCGFAAAVALVPLYRKIGAYSFGLPVTLVLWLAGTLLFLLVASMTGEPTAQAVPSLRSAAAPPTASMGSMAPAPAANLVRTEAVPAPQQSTPSAVPLKGGKPATIYVNLVGEGMVMLRPVLAEHVGRDFYLITETMPENERWEFGPGQVVRCEKKTLSSGKALVAVQEAPRAS